MLLPTHCHSSHRHSSRPAASSSRRPKTSKSTARSFASGWASSRPPRHLRSTTGHSCANRRPTRHSRHSTRLHSGRGTTIQTTQGGATWQGGWERCIRTSSLWTLTTSHRMSSPGERKLPHKLSHKRGLLHLVLKQSPSAQTPLTRKRSTFTVALTSKRSSSLLPPQLEMGQRRHDSAFPASACVCARAGSTFDGNYVAQITSSMRARSPHMALSSVVYETFDAFPDLALMVSPAIPPCRIWLLACSCCPAATHSLLHGSLARFTPPPCPLRLVCLPTLSSTPPSSSSATTWRAHRLAPQRAVRGVPGPSITSAHASRACALSQRRSTRLSRSRGWWRGCRPPARS